MANSPARPASDDDDGDAHDDGTVSVSPGEYLIDTRTDTVYVVEAVNDDGAKLSTGVSHDELQRLEEEGHVVRMLPFMADLKQAMAGFVNAVAEAFRPLVESFASMGEALQANTDGGDDEPGGNPGEEGGYGFVPPSADPDGDADDAGGEE